MWKIIKILLLSVLFVFAQACASPVPSTPDPNAVGTAIVGTIAALTQAAPPGIPITGPESPTPTQTQAASPTPLPTFTPIIISVPQISVSVNTNCRIGPGQAYGRVGALLIGEVAEVLGRSADGKYWVIRNPDREDDVCWLWGEYATITGVPGVLPVFTPPPTPTATNTATSSPTPTRTLTPAATATLAPSFTASYSNLESCTGTGWWVDVQMQNTGGIPFESIALTIADASTGASLPLYSDDFTDRNGCDATNNWNNLPPGAARLVSSPSFSYDPSGHALRVTVTLCSNPAQSGTCMTQVINFTP